MTFKATLWRRIIVVHKYCVQLNIIVNRLLDVLSGALVHITDSSFINFLYVIVQIFIFCCLTELCM